MDRSVLSTLPPIEKIGASDGALAIRRIGAGPRIVLLHGGPGLDHHLLLPLAVRLASRFEVLLPDLPGHGRSHRAGNSRPDLDRLLSLTKRWLATLNPTPTAIGGHSLGAWLAREALLEPRLEPRIALLLSAPTPVVARSSTRFSQPRRLAHSTRAGARRLRADLLELIDEETGVAPNREFLASLTAAQLVPPHEYASLLAQLRRRLSDPPRSCPVDAGLFLYGSEDRIAPPSDAGPLIDATPGAELEVLDDCGHFPFAHRADVVADRVVAFLDRSLASRANRD